MRPAFDRSQSLALIGLGGLDWLGTVHFLRIVGRRAIEDLAQVLSELLLSFLLSLRCHFIELLRLALALDRLFNFPVCAGRLKCIHIEP